MSIFLFYLALIFCYMASSLLAILITLLTLFVYKKTHSNRVKFFLAGCVWVWPLFLLNKKLILPFVVFFVVFFVVAFLGWLDFLGQGFLFFFIAVLFYPLIFLNKNVFSEINLAQLDQNFWFCLLVVFLVKLFGVGYQIRMSFGESNTPMMSSGGNAVLTRRIQPSDVCLGRFVSYSYQGNDLLKYIAALDGGSIKVDKPEWFDGREWIHSSSGEVILLGVNSNFSLDSRRFGAVKKADLAQVMVGWFEFDDSSWSYRYQDAPSC